MKHLPRCAIFFFCAYTAFLGLSAMLSCMEDDSLSKGLHKLSGVVILNDGTPIRNEIIVLYPTEKQYITGANGEFEFDNLAEGSYTLAVGAYEQAVLIDENEMHVFAKITVPAKSVAGSGTGALKIEVTKSFILMRVITGTDPPEYFPRDTIGVTPDFYPLVIIDELPLCTLLTDTSGCVFVSGIDSGTYTVSFPDSTFNVSISREETTSVIVTYPAVVDSILSVESFFAVDALISQSDGDSVEYTIRSEYVARTTYYYAIAGPLDFSVLWPDREETGFTYVGSFVLFHDDHPVSITINPADITMLSATIYPALIDSLKLYWSGVYRSKITILDRYLYYGNSILLCIGSASITTGCSSVKACVKFGEVYRTFTFTGYPDRMIDILLVNDSLNDTCGRRENQYAKWNNFTKYTCVFNLYPSPSGLIETVEDGSLLPGTYSVLARYTSGPEDSSATVFDLHCLLGKKDTAGVFDSYFRYYPEIPLEIGETRKVGVIRVPEMVFEPSGGTSGVKR